MSTTQTLIKQLKADRKKAGMLLGLVAMGLLLWGRLLFSDGVPRTAMAVPSLAVPAAENAARADNSGPRRDVAATLHTTVTRDLFKIDPAAFPKAEEPEPQKVVVQAKSAPEAVDEQTETRRVVALEAKSLKLKSTLLGSQPRAVINGKLLAKGDTVAGFEVVDVRSRQVTVRKNGVLVELEM